MVKPIPDGYSSITPYLAVRDATKALEFYKAAFGAHELFRLPDPAGRIAHAEFILGNSILMIADENADMGFLGPQSRGGPTSFMHFYVEDVDTVVEQAVAAGAKIITPLKDEFYGDRTCRLEDPFGHLWGMATHKEDVSPEEMQRRLEALMSSANG